MSVSSRVLSRWYVQLATNLEAGLSLERSIGALPGPPPALRSQLQSRLVAGDSVAEALERGGAWLPPVDRQLITAAADAGRLPEVLRRTASMHEEAAQTATRTFLAALYPLVLAHFAVVALPIGELVNGGGIRAYTAAVFRVLVPLWICGILGVVAVRQRWRAAAVVLDALPFVGGHRRARAIANLAMILEAQLVAGIRLDVAWLQAAEASGDRRLHPLAIAVAEGVQRGEAVGPKLLDRRELPAPFADFYANGEQTGRLDVNLALIQREFRTRAAARLQVAAMVYPGILFAAIALGIAYRIVNFWLSYFKQLEQFQ